MEPHQSPTDYGTVFPGCEAVTGFSNIQFLACTAGGATIGRWDLVEVSESKESNQADYRFIITNNTIIYLETHHHHP